MAFFKCKMCGGELKITERATIIECEYCGSKQTLPKLDDDRKANLYDRANHFRRNNDFDKAMSIYEQILNEDNTDAESYWSILLCRYGIEYVEDPATHKRMPTVNRAQFTSIFDDEDYKSALKYADGCQREIYETEAAAINELQKGILAISQKEEPFDVFICYKETDNNGRRTQDSVLATELYHELTRDGFKVFFSRITLEDKLGIAYEPYIFAALNSAKVMVVLGTRAEHFNAVWVKNEWSRYLALIKNGAKKTLIPAYRYMDPYDLPEEFSHLQAQDMSKLGFMQDLTRGIKKIIEADAPKAIAKETIVASATVPNITPLLKRAFMFLEDGEWESANEYCEKVLDLDPECAEAYLGKLMVEYYSKKREELKNCVEPFDDSNNYKKIIRFADEALKNTLAEYVDHIKTRNENARNERIYIQAKVKMEEADCAIDFKKAADFFYSIAQYKDSNELAQICVIKESEAKAQKEAENIASKYKEALQYIDTYDDFGASSALVKAVNLFKELDDYKNSKELLELCEKKLNQETINSQKRAKRNKKIAIIVIPIVCAVIAFIIIFNAVIIPFFKYNDTIEKIKSAKVGDYVFFGSYEQDNNIANGKEEIEWIVLDIKDGKILVISKYALDGKQYNTSYEEITWESCTLRNWLDSDFISDAFSDEEKQNVSTVFLLSVTEADKYFNTDSVRMCMPTAYAEANGVSSSGVWDNKNCKWWLRTLGNNEDSAALVLYTGVIDEKGSYANVNDVAVRPAMWIDLNA